MSYLDFKTKEEGLEKLKDHVALRNKMGGALYWNIVNEECYQIAHKLLIMGVSSTVLDPILNG